MWLGWGCACGRASLLEPRWEGCADGADGADGDGDDDGDRDDGGNGGGGGDRYKSEVKGGAVTGRRGMGAG